MRLTTIFTRLYAQKKQNKKSYPYVLDCQFLFYLRYPCQFVLTTPHDLRNVVLLCIKARLFHQIVEGSLFLEESLRGIVLDHFTLI